MLCHIVCRYRERERDRPEMSLRSFKGPEVRTFRPTFAKAQLCVHKFAGQRQLKSSSNLTTVDACALVPMKMMLANILRMMAFVVIVEKHKSIH